MTSLPTWTEFKGQLTRQVPAAPCPDDCEICGEEFENERPVVLPCPSNHAFGLDCLVSWLETIDTDGEQCNTCPKCRVELFEKATPAFFPPEDVETFETFEEWKQSALEVFQEDFDFEDVLSRISLCDATPEDAENIVVLLNLKPRVQNMVLLVRNARSWEDANNALHSMNGYAPFEVEEYHEEGETNLTEGQIVAIQRALGNIWYKFHQEWRNAAGPYVNQVVLQDPFGSEFDSNAERNADESSPAVVIAVGQIQAMMGAQNPTAALIDLVNHIGRILINERGTVTHLQGIRLRTILVAADIAAHFRLDHQGMTPDDPAFRRYDSTMLLGIFNYVLNNPNMMEAMIQNHRFGRDHPQGAAQQIGCALKEMERALREGAGAAIDTRGSDLDDMFAGCLLMSRERYPTSVFYLMYNAAKQVITVDSQLSGSWIRHLLTHMKFVALSVAVLSI